MTQLIKWKNKKTIPLLIAIIVAFSSLFWIGQGFKQGEEMSFSEFMQFRMDRLDAEKIVIYEDKDFISITNADKERFYVELPKDFITDSMMLYEISNLGRNGPVDIEFKSSPPWGLIFLIVLVFGVLLYFGAPFYRNYRTNFFYKISEHEISTSSIHHWLGLKDEHRAITDRLLQNDKNLSFLREDQHTYLIEGPAGNGKSTFIKSLAKESGSSLYRIQLNLSEQKQVNSLLRKAANDQKGSQRAVILWLEDISTNDYSAITAISRQAEQTLPFSYLIMATHNRHSESLTKPLLNTFDHVITIENPTIDQRIEALEAFIHEMEGMISIHSSIWEEEYTKSLARQTEGFSLKELKNILMTAYRFTVSNHEDTLTITTLRTAFSKVISNGVTNHVLSMEEIRIAAYHEAGHAVVQMMMAPEGVKSVSHVTLTPQGRVTGHVSSVREEFIYRTKKELEANIKVLLGGRVAEDILLDGDVTTWSMDDLKKANDLIEQYVIKHGMSSTMPGLYLKDGSTVTYEVQDEINKLRDVFYKDTKETLEQNFGKVDNIARHLIHYSFIEPYQLDRILDGTSY